MDRASVSGYGGGMSTELRADAARNRARVLDAARRRLAEGDVALPMNALAAEAGVGVGTAYRHFGDRATLLAALASDRLQALATELEVAAQADDALASLGDALRAVLRAQVEDRAVAEVLRGGPGSDVDVARLLADVETSAQTLLTRVQDEGACAGLRADDVRRLLCGVEHAARLGDDPARDAERYVDALVTGLVSPRRT